MAGVMQIAEPEGYRRKGGAKQPKAAFADGTALPAKRPRTSNIADSDAARTNRRIPAITDFFNSIPPQTTNPCIASDIQASPGVQEETQGEFCQQSKAKQGVLGPQSSAVNSIVDTPGIIASDDSNENQSAANQGEQWQQTKPVAPAQSYERRRQIIADAAMRRVLSQQHNIAQHDAQLAASDQTPSPDISKLADEAHVSAVIDLVYADELESSQQVLQPKPQPKSQNAGGSQQPSCPICGQAWPAQTSNVEVNQHIDECLSVQLL